MARKRGGTFFTLDAEEAVVVKAALGSLAREIKHMPGSDAVRDLSEIAAALHERIAARFNACARKVRKA